MHIGIVGAGHAGIEAAQAARQAGAEVTVFSAEPVLPYFRPRLIAVAMGQTDPGEISMHPAAWYVERGIRLRVATPVTALDVAARTVTTNGVSEPFDALVLACGAVPRRPRFTGETPEMPVFTLWSMADALAIRARVRPDARLVVIGGSSLGIESAVRAWAQKMQVTIVEQMPRLMSAQLGVDAAGFLSAQVTARGLTVKLGHVVESLGATADGAIDVRLDDGSTLAADCVLVCIGAVPELSLARQAGLATARGISTDANLQAAPGIFVAGDVCQAAGVPARGVVREANAQGRLAGANAAAVMGARLKPFAPFLIPASVRCPGIEINAAGQSGGDGLLEERLPESATKDALRIRIQRGDGRVVGVQMIGTREGIDELVAQMGTS